MLDDIIVIGIMVVMGSFGIYDIFYRKDHMMLKKNKKKKKKR